MASPTATMPRLFQMPPAGRYWITWSCKATKKDAPFVTTHTARLLFQPEHDWSDEVEAGSLVAHKIHWHAIEESGKDLLTTVSEVSSDKKASVARLLRSLSEGALLSDDDDANVPTTPPSASDDADVRDLADVVPTLHDICPYDELTGGDVLYVDEVKILPPFRKCGFGLLLVERADHLLNSHLSMCLLNPRPLLQENDGTSEMKKAALEVATAKIERYFQLLGFERLQVGSSQYLARWNGSYHPTVCVNAAGAVTGIRQHLGLCHSGDLDEP
ncbi:Aste57867_14780 [Aphanomyces stellatus]|uniref:Aste57867_14780 protein n=1 Tax=Aphanomyces stellatus TaxID=120398 RepID=A0A485L476_9STRA|nr:hypothetical protein As57867_014725 [Aphanomyces stellatus]VFT91598.1 Aste57867_14780 [Aphanomyces stellatus]